MRRSILTAAASPAIAFAAIAVAAAPGLGGAATLLPPDLAPPNLAPPKLAPPNLAPAWPQATSDIPPEPDARFGVLANGMRYILMHNANPAHVTSLRLRIGAGSLSETDDQRGLAHFLEHMAFKGSTHVPSGDMVKLLQRHGLAFGADTNAFTTYDQTFYQLDLPESDDETLDLGLMLFRETASELTLDPKAMDPERGVIMSEERQRNTPAYEVGQKSLAFLLKGQPVPTRSPIGDAQVIRTATAQRLRDFYTANYRPEKTTLIAVGQFDLDEMEAKVRARFSDWRPKGPAAPEPDRGVVAKRGLEALVLTQQGVTPTLSVAWTAPPDRSADTRAKEYGQVIDDLAVAIVNRRLEAQAKRDKPPFLAAGLSSADTLKSIRITAVGVVPNGADWAAGLTAADSVLRETVKDGVTASELAFAMTQRRTLLQNLAVDMGSRQSPLLAQTILNTVESEEVFCTPKQNLAIFEEAVRDLTPETVNGQLRALTSGNGPLLTLVTPTPYPAGEAGVLKAWSEAEAAPLLASTAVAAKPWPYTDFGKPSTVVERRDVADLGITYIKLSNGVRIAFKHTDFVKNSVDVGLYMAGGLTALPRDRATPSWAAASLTGGGLKALTPLELEQTLNGRTYSAASAAGESDWVIGGRTNRANLLLEMQLLTAFITDPGWSRPAFERTRAGFDKGLEQIDATPAGVLSTELGYRLHDGDARFKFPNRADLAALTLELVQDLWRPALTAEPIDVVIVGDVPVEEVIAWTARTVGALPARPAAPSSDAGRTTGFPAPTAEAVILHHKGRADQAIAFEAWPTNDYYADPKEARALVLTSRIMTNRLLDQVRTAEGASYAPSAAAQASSVFRRYGSVSAFVETPPDKIKSFYDAVSAITADLRDHPPSADEMERVVKPQVEQMTKARQTNNYWIGALVDSFDRPERLENIRTGILGYQAITAADIQAAARKYLTDQRAWKLEVLPAAGARPAPKP